MAPTDQHIRAIVFLAKSVRDQCHGARKWDEAGIAAAVAKVRQLHLADVTQAAMRAADDRSLDTPGAISNPSAPCWQERKPGRTQPREPFDRGTFCAHCEQPEPRCRCEPPYAFESKHDYDQRLARDPRRTTKEIS